MKKLVLILLLICGFHQLKAQQKLEVKPGNPLLGADLFKPFKPMTDSSWKRSLVHPKTVLPIAQPFYSTMPVVKLSSTDHMPIAVVTDPERHSMVERITVIDPLAQTPKPTP